MKPISPQQVVGGLNRRESSAFTWVYDAYHAELISMARTLTHRSSDAGDLAQEVFLKFLWHDGRFETLEKVRHFLHNTTRNKCLDYMRHREVMNSNSDTLAQYYGSDQIEIPAPVKTFSSCINLFCQSIEKLPPQSKQVLLLWHWDDLSNAEIAKRMRLSKKTVDNHKTRALKFLRAEVLKRGLYIVILFLLKFLK